VTELIYTVTKSRKSVSDNACWSWYTNEISKRSLCCCLGIGFGLGIGLELAIGLVIRLGLWLVSDLGSGNSKNWK